MVTVGEAAGSAVGASLTSASASPAADERADRDAVQRAIGALNERQWRAATITSDPKALADFQRLLRRKNLKWQIRPQMGVPRR